MLVKDICELNVSTIGITASIQEAKQLMQGEYGEHVGTLVVLDREERPVGMVTNHDLALK